MTELTMEKVTIESLTNEFKESLLQSKQLLEEALDVYKKTHNCKQENIPSLILAYQAVMELVEESKTKTEDLHIQLLEQEADAQTLTTLRFFCKDQAFVNPYAGGPKSWEYEFTFR